MCLKNWLNLKIARNENSVGLGANSTVTEQREKISKYRIKVEIAKSFFFIKWNVFLKIEIKLQKRSKK